MQKSPDRLRMTLLAIVGIAFYLMTTDWASATVNITPGEQITLSPENCASTSGYRLLAGDLWIHVRCVSLDVISGPAGRMPFLIW